MEAPGVRLRGLALVVEKDAGPRLALRYDPCPDCDEGRLFRDLSPTDLAKLFSQPRAKTDQLVEVQLDGLLVVSCPAEVGDVAENEDEVVWGEVDVAADAAAPPPPRLKRFDVLWAATAARAGDLNNAWTLESLERAAKDVRAALRHEERRCGYVSRESAAMLAADDCSIEALKKASSLARELSQVLDGAMAHGAAAAKFNGWVAVRSRLAPMVTGGDDENADEDDDEEEEAPGDDEHAGESDDDDVEDTASENDEDDVDPRLAAARRARRRRTRRRYRPYETLLLLEDAASTLRDLPRDAAPQLRALVAHADPFATFHAIAARAGLPLPRVYRLARHLCEWKRARVIAVVRPDAVYAVDEVPSSIPVDARDAVRASDAMILAAFGPCKRLGDALDVLETTRGRDAATERVLALLRRGALRELHTYVLRVDAAPPPGLGAVATAARGKPARGERSDHLRLLHVFRALSPCFDGQHSLLEMMWRQDLSQAEVDAALRAFSDLVVTVQR